MSQREDEWVWGWDSTPGIVSVWAEIDGRATVWRRVPGTGQLVREEERFRRGWCWIGWTTCITLARDSARKAAKER